MKGSYKMFVYKRFFTVFLSLLAVFCLSNNIFFSISEDLILTGNLYYIDNGVYTLEIENYDDLLALNGRVLGFKIKSEESEESQSSGQGTDILGVRCVTEKRNSNIIFNAIQKMLVPSSDKKTLTFTIGASGSQEGYNDLVSLLSSELSNKRENVLVEYFDNRVNGNSASIAKVIYKVGPIHKSSSLDSGFVVSKTESESNKVEDVKKDTSYLQSQKVLQKINTSQVLSTLRKEKFIHIKLDENSSTIIPKKLMSDLMYDKYKDKEVIFERYEDQKFLYKITMPINNINLCEKFDIGLNYNDEKADKIIKDKFDHYKMISFVQKGTLPASCNFEISMDLKGFDINNLKIYSLNENNKIERKNMPFIYKDNKIIITMGYGDIYIITDQGI